MSEQQKMDQERVAFEAWYLREIEDGQDSLIKYPNGHYINDTTMDAWYGWQARASLPVGVPDAYKCTPKNGGNPFVIRRAPDSWELRECDIEVIPVHLGDEETDQSIAADCYWHIADVMGTQCCWSVQEHVEFMREIVQDASEFLHDIPEGSVGGDDKAVELCRRIRLCLAGVAPGYTPPLFAPAAPTVKAEQCMPCGGWGVIAAEPGDPVIACEHCNKAPSLQAAGSAVEEVEVVGYRFFHVDHGYIFRRTHTYEGNPTLEAHSLMTIAQHERIVAQLAARDAGEVRVPVEFVRFLLGITELRDCAFGEKPAGETGNFWWRKELRALLAQRERGAQS